MVYFKISHQVSKCILILVKKISFLLQNIFFSFMFYLIYNYIDKKLINIIGMCQL